MQQENSSDKSGKSTISIEIPSSIHIQKKTLMPVSYGLAILFFFFTFCDFRCGTQKIGSLTGMDMVFGTNFKPDTELTSSSSSESRDLPPSIWAIIAFGAALVGLGISFVNKLWSNITAIIVSILGVLSLLLLQISFKASMEEETRYKIIEVDFKFAYWAVLFSLILGAIFSILRITRRKKPQSQITIQDLHNSSSKE